jgi:hypothetical protein
MKGPEMQAAPLFFRLIALLLVSSQRDEFEMPVDEEPRNIFLVCVSKFSTGIVFKIVLPY